MIEEKEQAKPPAYSYGLDGLVMLTNQQDDPGYGSSPAKGAQGEAVEPPLPGRWHHGNGYLVCGSFRIARADWEAGICAADGMRDQVFDWICERLNTSTRAAVPDIANILAQLVSDSTNVLNAKTKMDDSSGPALVYAAEAYEKSLQALGASVSLAKRFAALFDGGEHG